MSQKPEDKETASQTPASDNHLLNRLVMPIDRWELLMDEDASLTKEEISDGWHFCYEWDGLLVGPGMPEQECCKCKLHNERDEQ